MKKNNLLKLLLEICKVNLKLSTRTKQIKLYATSHSLNVISKLKISTMAPETAGR